MTIAVTLGGERFKRGLGLVASLPRTLRLSQDPFKAPADLMLVDGGAEWTDRAAVAIEAGIRTVVVLDPTPADPTSLADAADALGARVATVCSLTDLASLGPLRARLDDGFSEFVLDGSTDGRLDDLLFSHLRLLQSLGIEDLQMHAVARSGDAYIIEGTGRLGSTSRRLRLTGARGPGSARTCLIGHAGGATARLVWQAGTEARPAKVSFADADGLLVLPAIHEGGRRHGLRTILAGSDAAQDHAHLRQLRCLSDLLHSLLHNNR